MDEDSVKLSARLRQEWAVGRGEGALREALTAEVLADASALAEVLEADAEERWDRGHEPVIETYLSVIPDLETRPEACRALLLCELARREDRSEPAVADRLKARLPALAEAIDVVVGFYASFGPAMGGLTATLEPGERLGRYELRERIGRGSFGEVWRAWDDALGREVALKLLPEPTDREADTVLDEARAAAALEHDHIVRVHSAGRFEEAGLLYIDTQLVGDASAGEPGRIEVGKSLEEIAVGARGEAFSPRRAAEVMERVCCAVAAAHARGVTHGDIKPGNILLTPSGRPMVADFGLAVVASVAGAAGVASGDEAGSVSESVSITTGAGRITGTPAYMAPEQARGEKATPLTDVYSLGATLLALLIGDHPFSPSRDAANPALDVIEQVRERPPAVGRVEAIDATLGAICARATRQDPDARYVSAAAMGRDLRAWLGGLPTDARPMGVVARGGLWYRRHALLASVVAVAVVALGGLGARYVLVVRAERDRAVVAEVAAERALGVSEAVNAYMKSVLGAANPRELGQEATITDALSVAIERVTTDLTGQPLVEAGVRGMIGATYLSLGRLDEADVQLTLAHEMHLEHLGPLAPETLGSLYDLSALRRDRGNLEEAERLLGQVIAGRESTLGADHEETLLARTDLGQLYITLERFDEAEVLLRETVARLESVHGIDNPNAFIARKDLSSVALFSDRVDEAEQILRYVLAGQERTIGPDHPDTLVTVSDLASVLRRGDEAQQSEAIGLFLRALEGFRARQPPGHMDRVIVMFNLANALRHAGRPGEALEYSRSAVAEGEIGLGGDHYVTIMCMAQVGGLLAETGQVAEGREALVDARHRVVEVFGEGHAYVEFIDKQLLKIDRRGAVEAAPSGVDD